MAAAAASGIWALGSAGFGSPPISVEEQARHNPSTVPHVLRIGDIGDPTSLNPMFIKTYGKSLASMAMAWLSKYDHDNRPRTGKGFG